MSFNPFMLPALPQTPAAGLKGPDSVGPTTGPNVPLHSESTHEGRSFLATLNKISDPHNSGCRDSKSTANTGPNSEKSNTDSILTATLSDPPANRPVGQETIAAFPSEDASLCHNPWETFGMLSSVLFGFSMNADLPSYNQFQTHSANGSDVAQCDNPAGLFKFEGQGLLMAWLAGIHPGEQMKAAISPDAGNLYFFQNPAAKAVFNQDSGANTDMPVQFFGLRQWMATMSAGNLNTQTAAFGPHAHPALTDLPNMQGVDSTVLGLNAESGGFEGQRSAATPDAIDVIKDFLLKMASHNQAKENDLSENTKMAVAGKGSRLSHWAPSNPNSETIVDPQLQGERKNVQPHKFQAAVKTADNLANPQNAADAIMAKPSEDISGMKSPNLKTQLPLFDTLANKVIQVEGDNKDSSLLYAQDQMPDRMLKLENAARTSASAQRSLSSQAMNQIVQKAVLSFHNGQNEVQIHLKPEFLGHIRMQIVTENQQVAIKILVELPFVKDMLESNLNQLKADLHAQGLKIDQLEVSVAHDSNPGNQNQASAEAAKLRALNRNPGSDDELSEDQNQSHADGAARIAESAIDYFA